jgi:hypothetical protein
MSKPVYLLPLKLKKLKNIYLERWHSSHKSIRQKKSYRENEEGGGIWTVKPLLYLLQCVTSDWPDI